MNSTPTNLIGYCGLYCGACGIHQGKVKQAVENLRKVMGAYGFDKISNELAKWEPAFQHYQKHEEVLDGIIRMFGGCPGCVGGGGDPSCAIRTCSKQKGYTTCAECPELETCQTVQRYSRAQKRLQEIKAEGVDKWAERMRQKVAAGYCYLDDEIK